MTSWPEYYGGYVTQSPVQVLGNITATIDSDATGTGWPTTLRVGDAYTADNGRAFRITIKNSGNTVLTALGGNNFASGSANVAYRFDRAFEDGSPADFLGSVTWVPAAGEDDAHFLLEVLNTETAKATAGQEYRGQLILWPGDEQKEITVDETCFMMLPKIAV